MREENRWLRAENTRLAQRLETLETTIEDRINKVVEEAVAKATAPLLEIIVEKDREILRLKSQLAKDSSNSSKHSSRNGFKQVPNNREKSGRKRSGQSGHKGSRLNIPESLDELVEQGVAEHIILSDVADGEAYVSDWTVDRKTITVYTEDRHSPGKPPEIQYSSELKAQVVYLSTVGLVAYKRLSQFFVNLPTACLVYPQLRLQVLTTVQEVLSACMTISASCLTAQWYMWTKHPSGQVSTPAGWCPGNCRKNHIPGVYTNLFQ